MKRLLSPYVKLTAVAAAMVLLFSSCKKLSDTDNTTVDVARLMAFNLAIDKGAVDIALSNSRLTVVPLSFGNYTGVYLNIYPGQREVGAYDNGSGTAFASTTANFAINNYYSVFTLGDSGTYRNVVVNDMLDSLPVTGDKAYIRYINAIPDSSKPTVTVTVAGTEVINKPEPFASVAAFTAVTAGDVTITVSNGTTISATRTITFEKNKIYTILLSGKPGASDPDKKVQIKFIANGIVT